MTHPIYKLAYIGAGCDLTPVKQFSYVKSFIFVDTLPRCEFDDYSGNDRFHKKWFSDGFKNYIIDEFKKEGFTMLYEKKLSTLSFSNDDQNPHVITFKSTNQLINYYMSCNFKLDKISELDDDLRQCNGLYLSGYFPHYSIMDYFKKGSVLIASSGSWYGKYDDSQMDELDQYNLVCYLHNNPKKSVFNLILCYKDGFLLECKDMETVYKITK